MNADTPISVPPQLPDAAARELSWRDLVMAVAIVWAVDAGLGSIAFLVEAIRRGGPGNLPTSVVLSPVVLAVTALLSTVLAAVVAWIFAGRICHKSFKNALALHRVPGRAIAISAGSGIVGGLVAGALLHFFSTGESMMARVTSDRGGMIAVTILAFTLPVFEEVYYRGFILPVLRRYWGPVWAVLAVSVWFMLAHAFQLAGDWVGLPVIFGVALLWGTLRHVYDSLVPPMVSHLAYNTVVMIITWMTVDAP